jgi:hypothetical protein
MAQLFQFYFYLARPIVLAAFLEDINDGSGQVIL